MAKPERDPYTGLSTTGHEWNGIKELMTPVPKAVKIALAVTIFTAIVLWVLFPTWPYGSGFTKGVLGIDQKTQVTQDLKRSASARNSWEAKLVDLDFKSLQSDPEIMKLVAQHGDRLFEDNCAVCHGASGAGGPGFPSLIDDQWLWGGDADTIMETLRVGINTTHEDTRTAEMLAFGDLGTLDYKQRRDVTEYVMSLSNPEIAKIAKTKTIESGPSVQNGKEIFAENCASCHGEKGLGNKDIGAPNLADKYWIYGGDVESIMKTLLHGRKGVMPFWEQRLSEANRKLLTLYVVGLGKDAE